MSPLYPLYIVKLSSLLFTGYNLDVSEYEIQHMDIFEQNKYLNNRAKTELIAIFTKYGLPNLIHEVHKVNFHLHEPLRENVVNYMCDHCHN